MTSRTLRLGYRLGIISGLLLYVLMSIRSNTLPGIHYDEVLTTLPAVRLVNHLNDFYGKSTWDLTIGSIELPIMGMEYMGPLKTYVLAGAFYVFGIHVTTLRLTAILLTLIGLFFTIRFAEKAFGRTTALCGLWLLVTDPTFILFFRTDYGPLVLAFMLRMAALIYLVRWWRTSHESSMIIAGALLGLGIYDKFNFLWFVAAVSAVGFLMYVTSPERPRLSTRTLLFAFGAGILTSAPLWIYNLTHHWITFSMATMPGQHFSVMDLIYRVPMRSISLIIALNGLAGVEYMFYGADGSTYFGSPETVLLPLSALSVIFLLIIAIRKRRYSLAAMPLMILIIGADVFLTPRPIGVHHFLMLYPFPHLCIGLLVSWIISHSYSRIAKIIAAGCILGTVLMNCSSLIYYDQLMRKTGGTGVWSDVIYQLAETLKTEYPDRPIQIMDWAIGNQLYFLSGGHLPLRELFWRQPTVRPTGELNSLVNDEQNIFLLHAPDVTIFPNPRMALETALQSNCEIKFRERKFYDRISQPVYTIVELSRQECPADE